MMSRHSNARGVRKDQQRVCRAILQPVMGPQLAEAASREAAELEQKRFFEFAGDRLSQDAASDGILRRSSPPAHLATSAGLARLTV
jgi:hypothetical protein